jgi:hypothetical protein
MKKFLPGLAVFAGIVSGPAGPAVEGPRTAPVPEYRSDPRMSALKGFFRKFECPAADYVNAFLEAADDYDLDWRLLPSISYVESSGGKLARFNNIFGWDSGRAQFSTPAAGIHEVGYRLAYSSLYRDKDTDAILATYNPVAGYAAKVKMVMRLIAPAE